MSEQMQPEPNRFLGKRPEDDGDIIRPEWVPLGAVWANGKWYLGQQVCHDPSLVAQTAVDRRQVQIDAANTLLAKTKAGLPAGYYRNAGLIYGRNGKLATDLPGGYIDDGRFEPDHEAKAAARLAAIEEATADEQIAIDGFLEAQEFLLEAQARRYKAHNAANEE